MELNLGPIGAGIAVLGIIGPGLGIGILAAVESHHHEEGHVGEEAIDALEDARQPVAAGR